MAMHDQKENSEKKNLSPTIQKILVICASLVFCTLIFLFVGQQASSQPKGEIISLNPTPRSTARAKPTPYGVRETVVAEALFDLELGAEAVENTPHAYAFSMEGHENLHTVEFWLVNGYVRGFTVRFPFPPLPQEPAKDASPQEHDAYEGDMERYHTLIGKQQDHLMLLLAALSTPLDHEGCISPAARLKWEAEIKRLYKKGGVFTGKAGSFSFSASNPEDGIFSIALGNT